MLVGTVTFGVFSTGFRARVGSTLLVNQPMIYMASSPEKCARWILWRDVRGSYPDLTLSVSGQRPPKLAVSILVGGFYALRASPTGASKVNFGQAKLAFVFCQASADGASKLED